MNIVSKNIICHEKVAYVANSTLLLVLLFLNDYEIAKIIFHKDCQHWFLPETVPDALRKELTGSSYFLKEDVNT